MRAWNYPSFLHLRFDGAPPPEDAQVTFITRHEGFVWIKRKHYFEAARNPRYFWRKYGNPPVRTGGIDAQQNTSGSGAAAR
jgi:hypothetical protein